MTREPGEPQEINWEEVEIRYIEKIRAWAEARNIKMTKEELGARAAYTQNFAQYFITDKKGEVSVNLKKGLVNGVLKVLPDEENEKRTMREYVGERNQQDNTLEELPNDPLEPAASPKDFFDKHSEKFFDVTVNQFLRDIHQALQLAGLSEEDLKRENYTKEKKKLSLKAIQYLIDQGYNANDIIT